MLKEVNNPIETELEQFGLGSSLLLGVSLLLPSKSPAIPNFNSVTELKKHIASQRMVAETTGDTKLSNFYDMLYSTIQVESNWNDKARSAADKSGRAWGLLQFRQSTIDDINRVYKTKYTINDALDMNKAIDMYEKYYNMLVKYHKYYKEKLGKSAIPNTQELSMMYNQGLTAWNPKNLSYTKALNYYGKIKNNLKNKKRTLVRTHKV